MCSSIINIQREPLSQGASTFSTLLLTAHLPSTTLFLMHLALIWVTQPNSSNTQIALLCETAPARAGICVLSCGCNWTVIKQWNCQPENLLFSCNHNRDSRNLGPGRILSFFFFFLYKAALSTHTYFTNKSHSCCDTKISIHLQSLKSQRLCWSWPGRFTLTRKSKKNKTETKPRDTSSCKSKPLALQEHSTACQTLQH